MSALADRPNFLVITVCSLRADHVGAYGYGAAHTPNLDALAAEGTMFERAWSNATFTLPSHISLLTGLHPGHSGVVNVQDALPEELRTLPERLRSAGYQTVAYAPVNTLDDTATASVAGPCRHRREAGPVNRASFYAGGGLERGFDTFLNGSDVECRPTFLTDLDDPERPFFAVVHLKTAHSPYAIGLPGSTVTDHRLLDWAGRMSQDPRAPDSSGAGLPDPAEPSTDDQLTAELARDPALKQEMLAAYDQVVTDVDAEIGDLLDGLRARALLTNTVVVVVGDHGEAFGERGRLGHQGWLTPEVLHVPLLVRLPAGRGAGGRVTQDVSLVDLAPTLLELAGSPPLPDPDGQSLLPLLLGPGERVQLGTVIAQASVLEAGAITRQEVVIQGPLWLNHTVSTPMWTLWRDVSGAWVDVTAKESGAAASLFAATGRLPGAWRRSGPSKEITPDERRQLELLGYR